MKKSLKVLSNSKGKYKKMRKNGLDRSVWSICVHPLDCFENSCSSSLPQADPALMYTENFKFQDQELEKSISIKLLLFDQQNKWKFCSFLMDIDIYSD